MVDSITVYQGNSNITVRSTFGPQQEQQVASVDTTIVTQRRRWLLSMLLMDKCSSILGWSGGVCRRIVRLYSYTMLLGWFLLVIAVKQGWFILKIASLVLCGLAVLMFIVKEVDRLSRRQHPIGVPLTVSSEACRILNECSRPAIYGRMEVGGECPLCIRKMRSESTVVELVACGHAVHTECLKSFIKYSSPLATRTCPLCNRPFIPQTATYNRTSLPLPRGSSSTSSMMKTIQLKNQHGIIGRSNDKGNSAEIIPTTSTLPAVLTPTPPRQSSRTAAATTIGYYNRRGDGCYSPKTAAAAVPTV